MRYAKKMIILTCLKQFTAEYGYPPTVRELCKLTGYSSTSTIHRYLVELRKDGLLTYEPTKPRTVTAV